MKQIVRWGASRGALIWAVYALVEFFLSSTFPLLRQDRLVVPGWHWRMSFILVCGYVVLGAILGSLAALVLGLLFRRSRSPLENETRIRIRAAASATLVLAFSANLAAQTLPVKESYLSLVSVVLLAGAFGLALGRPERWERVVDAANPWVASLFLLGPAWIAVSFLADRPRSAKLSGASVLFAVLLAIAIAVWKSERMSRLFSNARGQAYLVVAAFMALGCMNLFLSQEPRFQVPQRRSESRSPNVVFIVMDTVRADHLSLYGYERDTSPNLSALAGRATVYTRPIATSERTLPTHASFFTGLYPSSHRAVPLLDSDAYGRPLGHEFRTLAEILSENGYVTLAAAANFAHLAPYFQLNQGFDFYDAREPLRVLHAGQGYFLRHGLRRVLELFADTSELDRIYRRAEEINRIAFSLLDRVKGHAPFFLFVNFFDAHLPYIPPPPFDSRYPGKGRLLTHAEVMKLKNRVLAMRREVTAAERAHLVSQYDGSIAYVDAQIGLLLDRLRELDLFDDSLIIVTSDHGEIFGERNLFEHSCSLYRDHIHVPLIVKYPRQSRPERVEVPVSGVDLMPTVLDVIGAAPAETDGRSLLAHSTENGRPVFSEFYSSELLRRLHPRFRRFDAAVVDGNFKLIASSSGGRELFDLSEDPGERMNLARTNPEKRAALEKLLGGRLDALMAAAGASERSEVDDETPEQLKSLGYAR